VRVPTLELPIHLYLNRFLDTTWRPFSGRLCHTVIYIPQGDTDVLRVAWLCPLYRACRPSHLAPNSYTCSWFLVGLHNHRPQWLFF